MQEGALVASFHQRGGRDDQFVTSFHIRQGDRVAGLAWTLRDARVREILVFQSTEGFVDDGVDPTIDRRQRVVYQGTGSRRQSGRQPQPRHPLPLLR